MGEIIRREPQPIVALDQLESAARDLYQHAKAGSTWTAYRSDWKAFQTFCSQSGLESMPSTASTVVLWCVHRAQQGKRVSTIERSLAAIKQAHDAAGQASPVAKPEVREALRGLRRQLGVRPSRKVPTIAKHVRSMVDSCGEGTRALRDRAILLVGFAGAFRRSELVALDVGDVTFEADGLLVLVRRSKADQIGEGQTKAIPVARKERYCPVAALRAWMSTARVSRGPLFRVVDRWGNAKGRMQARQVSEIVQKYARTAGLDPKRVGGHSLRAGFVTQAARMQSPEYRIMEQTGHKSSRSLSDYIREADRLGTSAAKGILDEKEEEA